MYCLKYLFQGELILGLIIHLKVSKRYVCRITWSMAFRCAQLTSFPHSKEWRRKWQPTPVLLPGKSHGRRGLVGYTPWSREESDTTERLHFHFSLSCIGEGNGNPLQCFHLENPRDGGAWWAAVCGVAQSRTWLKWLSSSSIVRKFLNERS